MAREPAMQLLWWPFVKILELLNVKYGRRLKKTRGWKVALILRSFIGLSSFLPLVL